MSLGLIRQNGENVKEKWRIDYSFELGTVDASVSKGLLPWIPEEHYSLPMFSHEKKRIHSSLFVVRITCTKNKKFLYFTHAILFYVFRISIFFLYISHFEQALIYFRTNGVKYLTYNIINFDR